MQTKTILILLDGLNSVVAKENLGFLEHLQEKNQIAKYEVLGELPSSSRPMYETIFTGKPCFEHGITNNKVVRLSNQNHLFKRLRENGKTSLLMAYHWISELYFKAPFDVDSDMEIHDEKVDAFFYYEDTFPDSHLYSLAACWMKDKDPDFVFIHPMGIDDAGHKYSQSSKEYARACMINDLCISRYYHQWIQRGYNVLVIADHGMNDHGLHGGNSDLQRKSALYLSSPIAPKGFQEDVLSTLDFATILWKLCGLRKEDHFMETGVKWNDEIK